MRVEHRYFTVNQLRLHAVDFGGAGHPIVLLHDRFGHAAVWRDIAAPLSLWGTVFALDLRGHGDSQWPHPARYDLASLADDVRGVCHVLTDGLVDLVGLGWGALIAARAAVDEPGLLRRLALLDPPIRGVAADPLSPPAYEFASAEGIAAAERAKHARVSQTTIDQLAGYSTRPGQSGGLVRKFDPALTDFGWPQEDGWLDMQQLKCPTMVVRAGASGALSDDDLIRIVSTLADARCETILSGGRSLPIDQGAELADLLVDFFGEGDIDEL